MNPFLSEFKLTNNIPIIQKDDFKKEIYFNDQIILKNLNFRFEKSKKNTLTNINLEIKKGSYVGISGESGAGKTTLMNLLLGLYKPTSGQILIDGKESNSFTINFLNKILPRTF